MELKSRQIAVLLALGVAAFLLSSSFETRGARTSCPVCPVTEPQPETSFQRKDPAPENIDLEQLTDTLYHYAVSPTVPQQRKEEIGVSYPILKRRRPCNFLIFGLGYDSPMWHSFNLGGRTEFLEENEEWVQLIAANHTFLHATTVHYSKTNQSEQQTLLSTYMNDPSCRPQGAVVKGNTQCKLALSMLPNHILDTQWDMIMIDAPRGWAEYPGRHAAVWTAAVLARNRKGGGVTDVFIHDVNRKAEATWAEELLCVKYRKHAVGKLWHFEIPNKSDPSMTTNTFC